MQRILDWKWRRSSRVRVENLRLTFLGFGLLDPSWCLYVFFCGYGCWYWEEWVGCKLRLRFKARLGWSLGGEGGGSSVRF
jgi:hypothetical protein